MVYWCSWCQTKEKKDSAFTFKMLHGGQENATIPKTFLCYSINSLYFVNFIHRNDLQFCFSSKIIWWFKDSDETGFPLWLCEKEIVAYWIHFLNLVIVEALLKKIFYDQEKFQLCLVFIHFPHLWKIIYLAVCIENSDNGMSEKLQRQWILSFQ